MRPDGRNYRKRERSALPPPRTTRQLPGMPLGGAGRPLARLRSIGLFGLAYSEFGGALKRPAVRLRAQKDFLSFLAEIGHQLAEFKQTK